MTGSFTLNIIIKALHKCKIYIYIYVQIFVEAGINKK